VVDATRATGRARADRLVGTADLREWIPAYRGWSSRRGQSRARVLRSHWIATGADPKDADTRKALARIKRLISQWERYGRGPRSRKRDFLKIGK